jgi:hypothetical protein
LNGYAFSASTLAAVLQLLAAIGIVCLVARLLRAQYLLSGHMDGRQGLCYPGVASWKRGGGPARIGRWKPDGTTTEVYFTHDLSAPGFHLATPVSPQELERRSAGSFSFSLALCHAQCCA